MGRCFGARVSAAVGGAVSAAVSAAVLIGCRPEPVQARLPQSDLIRNLELTAPQESYLARLAEGADEQPADFNRRKASGMAHMRFTLSGALSLRDRAEADLEAAFDLNPNDPELTRTLGRFYNLRAVANDDTKADKQVEVYRALLGDTPAADLASREFVAWTFLQLGIVLSQRNSGRLLKALSTVKALEAELQRRTQAEPGNVELWALAGNFAFFLAGNIPFDRGERVEAGVRYFERVRDNWGDMRAGAKDGEHCPNTYENFMFELAEAYLVLDKVDAARAVYQGLLTPGRPPSADGPMLNVDATSVTRAKEQIAFVSAERLRNAEAYAGDMRLMPPWPSDVGNCIVCHAYASDVPLTTLHVLEPIALNDIPTASAPKPVPRVGVIPADLRAVLDTDCVPCHGPDGQAASYADFTSDEGVFGRVGAVERRIRAGEMPPDHQLAPEAKANLLAWLRTGG